MNIKQLLDSESVSKLKPYQKILILGAPGAGKSYLAKKLKDKLKISVFHLDQYFWLEDWVPVGEDQFRESCLNIVKEESWIMDGNYGSTFDIRWPSADLVIFLDTNPWLCLWRQLLRVGLDRLGFLNREDRPYKQRERLNIQLFWFTIKFREAHGHLIDCRMRELYPQVSYLKI